MTFYKGLGMQNGPLTGLQRAFFKSGLEDGGREYVSVVCVDETATDLAKSESTVYINKSDFQTSILQALQRGDVQLRQNDIALADSGRVRKSVLMHLYPDHDWSGETADVTEDGSRMVKGAGAAIVRNAYGEYTRKDPGANLREAAAELDALIRHEEGR